MSWQEKSMWILFTNKVMFLPKLIQNSIRIKTISSHVRYFTVLGIETSCDDTGCAIVTSSGKILGESLHSQALIHLRNGGIIPPIARDLHAEHITEVVNEALEKSNKSVKDFDAIAATVKPGLSLSLLIGARYAQSLSQKFNKPFIPIHHMEAHALSVRMKHKVEFPFLVLLISGGHCLIAVAENVDKFILLGQSQDDAPGEAFDKIARRLKLINLEQYRKLSGGPAIEKASEGGDPTAFPFSPPLAQYRTCNFSFSGMKNVARNHIIKQEKQYDVAADGVIPKYRDLCASFQHAVTRHLCFRVQRAMDYVMLKQLIPQSQKHLVVAGGVACNKYITSMLGHVANAYNYELAVPPPKLCTDNGLMIAWNGVERFRLGLGVIPAIDAHTIDIQSRCSFGEDHSDQVTNENIKCKWVKLPLDTPQQEATQTI